MRPNEEKEGYANSISSCSQNAGGYKAEVIVFPIGQCGKVNYFMEVYSIRKNLLPLKRLTFLPRNRVGCKIIKN